MWRSGINLVLLVAIFAVVQSLSHVRLCDPMDCSTPDTSLSIANSWSLLKLMPIELVMPSSHLILCRPLLLPSIFPSIRVFSNESVLRIRWPKYWSFSFSISPFTEYSGLISFRMDRFSMQSKGLSRVFSSTTVQKLSQLASNMKGNLWCPQSGHAGL